MKKWMALGLVMSLTGSMLAACSSAEPSGQGNAGGTPEGGTAGIEPLKISVMTQLWNDVPDMKNDLWKEIQARTNTVLDIEWISRNDYNTKLDLVLASGSLPDIVLGELTNLSLLNAVKQGVFWDLTPYLSDMSKYPNLQKNVPSYAWDFLMVDGKRYGIPSTRAPIDQATKYRKDWFDKFGIPEPQTLEELHAALKTIVHGNPKGTGERVIGLEFHTNFGGPFGLFDPAYDQDGGLIHWELSPAYTEMVNWYRQMYADGLMSKEFSVMSATQVEEMFTSGNSVTYTRNIYWDYVYEQRLKKFDPNAKVESIPYLQGDKGYNVNLFKGFAQAMFIPKKVPEEKLLRILEFYNQTASDENQKLHYFGIEGVHHVMEDGQIQYTEQGKKEMGLESINWVVTKPDRWNKVYEPSAPKAYNDAKIKRMAIQEEVGKIPYYQVLISETWAKVWPRYSNEFVSKRTQAIIGDISMEEYKSYVDNLNQMSDFKKSYNELAVDYAQKFRK